MRVQFEWQVGTDDGRWETLAQTKRRSMLGWLRRMPCWGWGILAVVLIVAIAAGYLIVHRRGGETDRQVGFDAYGANDLEGRAFARGEPFPSQRDEGSPENAGTSLSSQGVRAMPDRVHMEACRDLWRIMMWETV